MNIITTLYRQDSRGFVKDFLVGAFLVIALGVGAAVILVVSDWIVNG